MPEEHAPFQSRTNNTAVTSVRRVTKYESEWGSNESEWMESAKRFEDACTEVYSQNEVLKQYSASVIDRTARSFEDDNRSLSTKRRTVSARRVRKPW